MFQRNASNCGSDREDSPDVLSELDKQEELLNNITMKNKHIKRLLRDIEQLEARNTVHLEQIQNLKMYLSEATGNLTLANNQMAEYKQKTIEQTKLIEELNAKIVNFTGNICDMENSKMQREFEIQEFGKQLEQRAIMWKEMLEEKDDRLDSLRIKYDNVLEKNPGYDIDAERIELKRLSEVILNT